MPEATRRRKILMAAGTDNPLKRPAFDTEDYGDLAAHSETDDYGDLTATTETEDCNI